MPVETPTNERSITVEDVRSSLESPKVTDPFRDEVSEKLDRGCKINVIEQSCMARLTSHDVSKLPGERLRVHYLAHLLIRLNQIPSLVDNDGVEYLIV